MECITYCHSLFSFYCHRAFNIGVVIHMETTSDNTLCPAHILPALHTLVARHHALRSKVTPGDDTTNHIPLFTTGNAKFDEVKEATVRSFSSPMNWAVEVIRRKFDLSSHLFRYSFLQRDPKNLSLCLAFHHMAVDGVSIQTLLAELLSLLSGHSLTPNPPQITSFLPRITDFSGQSSDDVKRERNKRRWISLMSHIPKCPRIALPSPPESVSTKFSEWVAIRSPPGVSDMVNQIASCYKISQTVVLTAIFSIAVREQLLASEDVVVIGCASENRRRSQRDMVGHTVNLLPLKIDFPTRDTPIDLSAIISQIKRGWSLIMEGGVALIDLLPVLPCLRKRDPQLIGNRDRVYSASPLQIIFSFLPTPQKTPPTSISLREGSEVRCRVDYPRSCDAQADLFLEVRAPGNWEGNEAESSFLFTWEFRSAALSREKIEHLHNFTLDILTSCQSVSLNHGKGNDVIELPEGPERQVAESLVVSSYHITREMVEKTDSTQLQSNDDPSQRKESEMIFLRGARGLWLWPNQPPSTSELDDYDQHISPTSLSPSYSSPHPLQLPLQISLVEGATATTTTSSAALTPIQMFLKTAGTVPHCVAFQNGIEALTYGQAVERIEKLAMVLRHKGVVPGDHVGLVMPPCIDLYLSLLAIMRCGAAYVPLSLHHPQSTLLAMLDMADSKLVVTDTSTLNQKLPDYHGDHVCVDCDITDETSPLPEDDEYSGDLVAYIIFTSGTTGVPKGVAITNKSLSHFLTNFRLAATPRDTEITLTGCTVAWDGHVLDSLGPLLNGSCLVITPTLGISEGITFAFMSPSAASVLNFPRSMRCLLVGGEAFTRTCYESIKKIPKVMSIYGPTETTVFVSMLAVDAAGDVGRSFSNLGMPMPGVSLMVCDTEHRPVALGCEGELCIAGPQVSVVGYYKNRVKTRELFVQSPLPGYGVVYRTGDWTKMMADGTILFLGRTDDQVKLRGMRFQLHEVENALWRHPLVKMAAVAVRNPGSPSAQLVGFVTPSDILLDPLFTFLRSHLPSYMVPSAITALDELPLKNEGKVDRRALLNLTTPQNSKEMEDVDIGRGEVRVQECDADLAKRLATIFGKVLGLDSYPVSADFFTSGGQSLLLFRLLQMISRELDLQLSLSHLLHNFQNLSPLSLARTLAHSHLETSNSGSQRREEKEADLSRKATTQQKAEETAKESDNSKVAERKNRNLDSATAEVMESGTTDTSEEDEPIIGDFDYLEPVPQLATNEFLEQLLHNGGGGGGSIEEKCQSLQKETGIFIPPSSLERYPDTAALQTQLKLKRLIEYFEGATSPLVPLQQPPPSVAGGEDQPIIFLHGGIIGWPLPYLSLARSLSVSSIAVQRCEDSPTTSFEEMVAYYVKAILKTQPQGPYRLVGVCYGAMMVYEVARQLTDEGHTVELAVFVNHSPAIEKKPAIFDSMGRPLSDTFVDPIVFFRKILGLPLELGEKDGEGDEELEEKVKRVVAAILSSKESSWIPFTAPQLEKIYLGFFTRLRCAWRGYTPRPGPAISHCLLIRNPSHPLFHSHDFGLLPLLSPEARHTVAVAPHKMGMMSDPATLKFVTAQIETCLMPNSPTTHSVKGLE